MPTVGAFREALRQLVAGELGQLARRIEQGSPLSADEQQQLQTALTKVVKQQKDREGADVRG